MKPRSKKPKCTAANKACGMACKPKAAVCADQRKKLLASAKKGGLKGQAAKDYVQARIDRYKKLVSGKAGDTSRVMSGKKDVTVKPSTLSKNTSHTKKVVDPSDSIPELTDQQKEAINGSIYPSEKKIWKIIQDSPSITREESSSLASFIGSDYEDMNRVFWDKNFVDQADGKRLFLAQSRVAGAVIALKKLPPITKDLIEKTIKEFSIESHPMAEDGTLSHYLTLEDWGTVDGFMYQYKKAFEDGTTVTAGKMMSTSWREGGHPNFSAGANIEFKIAPKLDGTGTGKLVDKYKNTVFEDEILFPPDAKFKITKVEIQDAQPRRFAKADKTYQSDKYQKLSKILGKLEFDLSFGSGLSKAKNNIYPDGVWEEINKELKLGKFPSNNEEAKDYIADLKLKLVEESKNNKTVKGRVLTAAGNPGKYVIYKTEV